jgi:hypothetical protein
MTLVSVSTSEDVAKVLPDVHLCQKNSLCNIEHLCNKIIGILTEPCNRVLLEKLTVRSAKQEIYYFYGLRRFITVFTTARHWPISWDLWKQSTTSHPIVLTFILILSIHLCLGLLNGLSPWGVPTKILYAFLIPLMCATYPAHFIPLDLIILMLFGEKYKLWSSSLWNFLQRLGYKYSPQEAPNLVVSEIHSCVPLTNITPNVKEL